MKTIFSTLMIASFLMACGAPKSNEEAKAPEVSEEPVTQEAVVEEPNALVNDYIALKDALVATNAADAQTAAQTLATNEAATESIKSLAQTISETEDVELQREKFFELTTAFIEYAKANDLGTKLYVQYCPMAFNNTGANWVSVSSEIRNPYFGDRMLKCGRVDEEI